MKLHWLQHIPQEGLGSIEDWARERGHDLQAWRLHESARLPAASDLDGLIVLGGPMSVHDLHEHPWLEAERHLIRHCLQQKRPVLGICLGAQQLAMALGGEVLRGAQPEIGWFPVRLTAAGMNDPLLRDLPPEFDALHWHQEHISLPAATVALASSEACEAQAFRIGRHALGLQFHLEMTRNGAQSLCKLQPPEAGTGVQSAAQILDPAERFEAAQLWMNQVLDALFSAQV